MKSSSRIALFLLLASPVTIGIACSGEAPLVGPEEPQVGEPATNDDPSRGSVDPVPADGGPSSDPQDPDPTDPQGPSDAGPADATTDASATDAETRDTGTRDTGTRDTGTTVDAVTPPPAETGGAGTCSRVESGASGSEPGGSIPVCCAPTAVEAEAIREVFRLLNEHRAANGKPPLTYDPKLEATIQGHCMHMATHTFFSHTAPEASIASPWTRAKLCGTSANGENIAAGQQTPAAVMDSWKKSSGHNANMLGNFKRVGIGKSGRYWGQIFAN